MLIFKENKIPKEMGMHRKKRQRRVYINLFLLILLIISLVALYVVVRRLEMKQDSNQTSTVQTEQLAWSPIFQPGQQVQLLKAVLTSPHGEDWATYQPLVGQVVDAEQINIEGQIKTSYRVQYGPDQELSGILEEELRAVSTPYRLGQEVNLLRHLTEGYFEDGRVTAIRLQDQDGQLLYHYEAEFPSEGLLSDLTDVDFVPTLTLPFEEANSGAENDAILRQALENAKNNPAMRLNFPAGRFTIGSQTPEKDYQLLTSNLMLRGQDTTLVVDGSARWFGLATGPGVTEGLSHFAMSGLTFEAKDLKKGNQFLLMANHGQNWLITNNRFTLVHQMSSHIFDLGGVQDALFMGNVFEGYAPELTGLTEFGSYTSHNVISEAIQFDASSNNGEWDGGLLKAIDPNYQLHNQIPYISHQITVTGNHFLPYLTADGSLIAHGASIGQHSSGVGYVAIVDNVFSDTITHRFAAKVDPGDQWLYQPIHLQSDEANDIYDNLIN